MCLSTVVRPQRGCLPPLLLAVRKRVVNVWIVCSDVWRCHTVCIESQGGTSRLVPTVPLGRVPRHGGGGWACCLFPSTHLFHRQDAGRRLDCTVDHRRVHNLADTLHALHGELPRLVIGPGFTTCPMCCGLGTGPGRSAPLQSWVACWLEQSTRLFNQKTPAALHTCWRV